MDLLYGTKEDKMICWICRYVVHSSSSLFSIFLKLGFFFVPIRRTANPKDKPIPDSDRPRRFDQAELGRVLGQAMKTKAGRSLRGER